MTIPKNNCVKCLYFCHFFFHILKNKWDIPGESIIVIHRAYLKLMQTFSKIRKLPFLDITIPSKTFQ